MTSRARTQRSTASILVLAVLLIIVVGAVASFWSFSSPPTPLPLINQVLAGTPQTGLAFPLKIFAIINGDGSGYYLPIALGNGNAGNLQGTICAQDITSGTAQVCDSTTTPVNVPVNIGDSVTFSATPGTGYIWDHFGYSVNVGDPSSLTSTLNPLTVTMQVNAAANSGGIGVVYSYFDQVSGTTLGTFTQAWTIQYTDGSQYQAGPTQPQNIYQAGLGTNLPIYDSSRFYSVDVQVPITYTGGLINNGCTVGWNQAIIYGNAFIQVQNLLTTINGVPQYSGTVNLGQLPTIGVNWNPCSNPPNAPLIPNVSVKQLELWITNTQAYNQLDPNQQRPFAFDLQKALTNVGIQWITSFTLSVTVTETVTTVYTSCVGLPPKTLVCSGTPVASATGQPLTFGVPWSPPAGLSSQTTSTFTGQTQSFGCTGITCTLQGTITQTITSVSTCYTFSGTTACVVQTASTWTQSIFVTVTQCAGPPCGGGGGGGNNQTLLIAVIAAIVLVVLLVAAYLVFRQPAKRGRR